MPSYLSWWNGFRNLSFLRCLLISRILLIASNAGKVLVFLVLIASKSISAWTAVRAKGNIIRRYVTSLPRRTRRSQWYAYYVVLQVRLLLLWRINWITYTSHCMLLYESHRQPAIEPAASSEKRSNFSLDAWLTLRLRLRSPEDWTMQIVWRQRYYYNRHLTFRLIFNST